MNFNIKAEEELQKARSKTLADMIIARHEKLVEQINNGVFRPQFPLSDLIRKPKEKPAGSERNG